MGKLGGFLQIERHGIRYRDPRERAQDYHEFIEPRPAPELREQGARCMDCGVPFCHNGCPLGNPIPDWNDPVYRDRWQEAIAQLHATNNFPEFTGRLCPAPCEAACVLEIREGDAVTIKQIEHAIIDRAFAEGWVRPQPPPKRETGQARRRRRLRPRRAWPPPRSSPRADTASCCSSATRPRAASCASGSPTSRSKRPSSSAAYASSSRRASSCAAGSTSVATSPCHELLEGFDAVVLATGSRVPRDLPVPGRELHGVHFAMDYLYQRNRWVAREHGPEPTAPQPPLAARSPPPASTSS